MNRTKIIPAHLLLGLCLFFPILAMAQETKTFTVRFADGDFVLENDADGCVVINSGKRDAVFDDDTSKPGLPYVSFNLLVAPNQTCSDISFTILEKVKVKSGVTVAPNPAIYPTDGSVVPSEEHAPVAYTDDVYPAKSVEYAGLHKMDGYRFLGFNVCPFIYDAANRDLYLIKSLTVNAPLETESGPMKKASSGRIGRNMSDIVQGLVENGDELETLYGNVPETGMKRVIRNTTDSIEYLLVTNENLTEAFNELRNWKEEKGVTAKIVTIEHIKENYEGETVQLKIKNCLKDYYENHGTKFVLLGGDDTVVPVMGCYGKVESLDHTGKPRTVIDKSIPTDLFYACFDNNFEWNANGNELYGEVDDDIDMEPEVFLSRVPVRSEDDVRGFLYKVLNYEQGFTTKEWNNKFLMCGVAIDADTLFKYKDEMVSDSHYRSEYLFGRIKLHFNGERFRLYDTGTDFPGGADYDCNGVNLQEQLSKGYSFVDVMSHGSPDYFHLENDMLYKVEDALQLRNSKQTIITTTACNTNEFDNKSYEPCLSEAFIRSYNSGVIAFLGCSRLAWSPFGKGSGASEYNEINFYRGLFKESEGSRKYAEVVAKAKMMRIGSSLEDGGYRWTMFGLNPVGDPEMPIYTQEPKEFENVSFDFNGDSVVVDAGIDECRICVMSSDLGKAYYNVIKDVQKATFCNLSDGEIDICITRPGYIPWRYIGHVKYIQNETINRGILHSGKDTSLIGSDVTDKKEYGPVVIENGGKLEFKNGGNVLIKGEFEVKQGGELIIEPSN